MWVFFLWVTEWNNSKKLLLFHIINCCSSSPWKNYLRERNDNYIFTPQFVITILMEHRARFRYWVAPPRWWHWHLSVLMLRVGPVAKVATIFVNTSICHFNRKQQGGFFAAISSILEMKQYSFVYKRKHLLFIYKSNCRFRCAEQESAFRF